jgi:protocatechuate 3,4-dioxygenase, alpha subunit
VALVVKDAKNKMKLTATTWQTVGPFFRIGLERLYVDDLAVPGIPGERVEIAGRILDGDGQGVPDAVVEIWQADAQGKYPKPENVHAKTNESAHSESVFRGYGRVATQSDGSFHVKTIKPGRVPAPDGTLQAPHLAVSIFMRGLLRRLVTRLYFPEDSANSQDFILNMVHPDRRATLIAKKSAMRDDLLDWDVVLQGPHETVFFDC